MTSLVFYLISTVFHTMIERDIGDKTVMGIFFGVSLLMSIIAYEPLFVRYADFIIYAVVFGSHWRDLIAHICRWDSTFPN